MKTDYIYTGDCLEVMKDLPDNSIDSVTTDPPYGISFMGKKWDYDVPGVEVWQEALRILKPGGHALIACGTRTQHRMAVNIEDAGFEIRDIVAWVYGSGFPKSLNIGKAVDKLQGNEREWVGKNPAWRKGNGDGATTSTGWAKPQRPDKTKGNSPYEGWGTALKPAMELWTLARKPLGEKTVAENVLEHGVGGLNIDGCRVGTTRRTPASLSKNKNGIARQGTGLTGSEKELDKNIGRFPANFIHDGSDEVVSKFPESKDGVAVRRNGNNSKGMFPVSIAVGSKDVGFGGEGSAARFFYTAKASKSERNMNLEMMEAKQNSPVTEEFSGGLKLNGDGTVRRPQPTKNFHPTVKPIDLMQYLVRLITPKGGIVLDPFLGSGTTAIACIRENMKYIGIEKEPEYVKIAGGRISRVQPKLL